jgi:hypothetical protein
MSKRDHISLTTKLAAVLLEMKVADENGNLVPLIDRETAKNMTADQIVSLFHADHFPIPFATARDLGMTPEQYNHPTNITMRPLMEHRIKTATKDVPQIAKSNRLSAQHQDFQRRMLRRAGQAEGEEEKPKRKALIAGSRGTPFRKKINGQVVRRGE